MPEARVHTEYRHDAKRCTNEGAVIKALDDAYNTGYQLLGTIGGGVEGNIVWLIFQARVEVSAQPATMAPPAPAGAPQSGGMLGGSNPYLGPDGQTGT